LLQPYAALWRLLQGYNQHYQSWTKEAVIFQLNAETIETEVKTMLMTANKLTFQLKADPFAVKIANHVLAQITSFKADVPLIKIMCNPGLKGRHWDEITEIVGAKLRGDMDIKLNRLIDMEITQHIKALEEVSDTASREFGIEQIMAKQRRDWDEVVAEFKSWKDTGTFTVSGATMDEVQALLDDQLVKTQTMKGSPYAKIFMA